MFNNKRLEKIESELLMKSSRKSIDDLQEQIDVLCEYLEVKMVSSERVAVRYTFASLFGESYVQRFYKVIKLQKEKQK